jgi:hypothetical protein
VFDFPRDAQIKV